MILKIYEDFYLYIIEIIFILYYVIWKQLSWFYWSMWNVFQLGSLLLCWLACVIYRKMGFRHSSYEPMGYSVQSWHPHDTCTTTLDWLVTIEKFEFYSVLCRRWNLKLSSLYIILYVHVHRLQSRNFSKGSKACVDKKLRGPTMYRS